MDYFDDVTVVTPSSLARRESLKEEMCLSKPEALVAVLMSETAVVRALSLPYPPAGRYEIEELPGLWLEASGDNWIVCCANRLRIQDESGDETDRLPLRDQSLLQITAAQRQYRLFIEEINVQSRMLHNYMVLANTDISLGRAETNDIVCDCRFASRQHARLLFTGREWKLWDNGSTHGVYVNDARVQETELQIGDIIFLPGLYAVVGCGFLSIADGNKRVSVNPDKLRRVDDTRLVFSAVPGGGVKENRDLFNRFPRSRTAFEAHNIEVEMPPVSMGEEQLPMLLRLGSSMVMGSRAALTGNMAMLAGSVFLPVLSQQYTKEEREEYEKLRTERYRAYLDEKWDEIQEEKEREEAILSANYPVLPEVLQYTENKKKLWERRKTDDDFLTLRLGSGNIPMTAHIESPKRRFELVMDPLLDEMYDLAERKIELENAPILLNLKKDIVWGVLGKRLDLLAFAKAMLMRLALLYSYDETKMVVLADASDVEQMEFVRYLPHLWDDQRTIRFLACEQSDAYQISEYLAKALEHDLEKPRDLEDILKERPYYVVFALDKRLYDSMEILKRAMQQEKSCGMSVIAFFDDLPKECSVLIELGEEGGSDLRGTNAVVYLQDLDKASDHFVLDAYDCMEALRAMRELAGIELKMVSQAYALPKSYTFLEMYGVGRIEHLNILKRWQENDPAKSLSVPIGVGTNGTTFFLDLHQKYHGPHGLVAGTTGSGKSEFLITYILSLAVNFHPDEVAFLLIDYKGGGLAGAFDDPQNGIHLPHLVGTITNLDGPAIMRSLACIQSEMIRRQVVFNEAKSMTGEGTMDIYTYQKLYRKHAVKEPMPHLFIISDEFAELKQQQPEFLDALVSIARVGRSLGVHLILATQKPAGIVTDQIVSNSKFKVCLKVQDRADSMDMLKRPDASELRETGRFYLQVGSNELFALGQAAWCGADYEPQDTFLVKRDDSIQVIDSIGADVLRVAPPVKKSQSEQSQLVAIVQALTGLAAEQGLKPRALWMPPLEDHIDINAVPHGMVNTGDRIVYDCGIMDDPASLSQYPLQVDLTTGGHLLVVGEPRSGKTTFVQTMLYALTSRYTPEQLNFYALDYSGRLLKLFGALPHCGAVLTEEDDNQIDGFFDLINAIIRERKVLFSQMEVDSFETACQIREIPLILVIVDNLVGMANSRKSQKHLDVFHNYIKNSGVYGIRFIVTISHLNDASLRIKQEFTNRIVLHMRDKYEYGEALNQRIGYVPPDVKGRGLCIYKGKALELQLAMFAANTPEKERVKKLKEGIDDLFDKYADYETAARLRVVSETQTYEEFCQGFKSGRVPLGYSLDEGTAVALPLKQFSELTLYFGNPNSMVPVLQNFIYAGEREEATVVLMKHPEDSCCDELGDGRSFAAFDADPTGVDTIANTLLSKIGDRYKAYQAYCAENGRTAKAVDVAIPDHTVMGDVFRPIFVIFERYSDVTYAAKDSPELYRKFETIFLLAKRYRLFLIACVCPDEQSLLNGAPVYDAFNREKLAMLFGGNLSRQKIVSVPYGKGEGDKTSAYNRCLMSYRGGLYQVMMPCGVFKERFVPEDDRQIFKQA